MKDRSHEDLDPVASEVLALARRLGALPDLAPERVARALGGEARATGTYADVQELFAIEPLPATYARAELRWMPRTGRGFLILALRPTPLVLAAPLARALGAPVRVVPASPHNPRGQTLLVFEAPLGELRLAVEPGSDRLASLVLDQNPL